MRREQEMMRRSMERTEQMAKDEARRRDEYARSLEAKFEKERQEYRRQVCLRAVHFCHHHHRLLRVKPQRQQYNKNIQHKTYI